MARKQRPWLWGSITVLTVLLCTTALTLHYKNWVSLKEGSVRIISGFYVKQLPYAAMDSVVFVPRLPPMQRLNGFSALAKEKGIFREFKDSLTNKQVYVFVDNIEQQKIKLVYRDSAQMYLNLKDSVQTVSLLNTLREKAGLMSPDQPK
ncbi:hypothetical protein [Maribacter sp. 2307ULW6-5]|uniref:hypothetical protein n=1 Tax=Maribacter sp. 2307ULW6-5 TaxID=3386275 RepID=UPI0039BD6D38